MLQNTEINPTGDNTDLVFILGTCASGLFISFSLFPSVIINFSILSDY